MNRLENNETSSSAPRTRAALPAPAAVPPGPPGRTGAVPGAALAALAADPGPRVHPRAAAAVGLPRGPAARGTSLGPGQGTPAPAAPTFLPPEGRAEHGFCPLRASAGREQEGGEREYPITQREGAQRRGGGGGGGRRCSGAPVLAAAPARVSEEGGPSPAAEPSRDQSAGKAGRLLLGGLLRQGVGCRNLAKLRTSQFRCLFPRLL